MWDRGKVWKREAMGARGTYPSTGSRICGVASVELGDPARLPLFLRAEIRPARWTAHDDLHASPRRGTLCREPGVAVLGSD